MNSKKYTLALTIVLAMMVTLSCKKTPTGSPSPTLTTVKYEITSNLPFSSDPTYPSNIAYTNSSFSYESTTNVSGQSWTKEITIESSKKGQLSFGGVLYLEGHNGEATAKIYINGVVKAQVTNSDPGSNGLSSIQLETVYNL